MKITITPKRLISLLLCVQVMTVFGQTANSNSLSVEAESKEVRKAFEDVSSGAKSYFRMRPTNTYVIKKFTENGRSITLKGNQTGKVKAVGAGRVVWAAVDGVNGYKNLIIVKHSDSILTVYAESSRMLVKEGDAVTEGQAIADQSDALTFEVRLNGQPVDPELYLPRY